MVMSKLNKPLTDAEVNHLRKLLGWVRCEIGQSPEEMVQTVSNIAPAIGPDLSEEAKARLVAAHNKAASVPKYIRAAVKALEKTLVQQAGEVVDVEASREVREIGHSSNP
jgi:hypothetical protein